MPPFQTSKLPRFLSGPTLSDRPVRLPREPARFLGHLGHVLADFPPHVLICEEDLPLRVQLRGTFREIGCHVDTPDYSSAAFHLIESEEFDLVLMHYSAALVAADRIEFAPWARISTPFVLFDEEDRYEAARTLGFEGFKQLPITDEGAWHILEHHVFGDLLKENRAGV